MKRRGSIIPIFVIFAAMALIIFLFASQGKLSGITGFFEQALLPLQRAGFSLGNNPNTMTTEAMLQEENRKLQTQLVQQKELEKENNALRDQFKTSKPSPKTLLPAQIIGIRDEGFLIDKGTADDVHTGDVIVYKDNLIGKIGKASTHMSIVYLLQHKDISFTAQTVKTKSLGIMKGNGESALILDNVVLSDKLEKGDMVITKGDIDETGKGFPPDLVVGKIVSVNKKASALFQQAEVKSLVDFARLETVFVLTNK
jgi:rod shape-determining protein MreC